LVLFTSNGDCGVKIYTGNAVGKKMNKIKEYGLGIMISSSPVFKPQKCFSEVFCALDNGAFPAWQKGYPFPEKTFLETIDKCYELGIKLDFIVCPDIVVGGRRSLDFSFEWADGRLKTAPNLALVLQDGVTPDILRGYGFDRFKVLFVGGTKEWKKSTYVGWAEFCKTFKLQCHVGGCGTLNFLEICERAGVTSVDSTNFSRNESWGVLSEYCNKKRLFK
jgi:hypothetical protein